MDHQLNIGPDVHERELRGYHMQLLDHCHKQEHTIAAQRHALFWSRTFMWAALALAGTMTAMFYIAAYVAPPAHWRMYLEGLA